MELNCTLQCFYTASATYTLTSSSAVRTDIIRRPVEVLILVYVMVLYLLPKLSYIVCNI